MSSNKKVKEALIRRYGNKCFIERLHIRDTKGIKYTGCGQYKRMKQLTYHHIRMKKDGGKATIENGALLSAENHQWFHKQPLGEQEQMNKMFIKLKDNIDRQKMDIEIVEDFECPLHINFAEMSIDDNCELEVKILKDKKDYKKDKEKRQEKRELQKIKKEWEDR